MNLFLKLCFFIVPVLTSFTPFSQQEEFKLEGVWTVKEYRFAGISAMNDSIASQWLEKKAVIKGQLYFEYYKIPNYKDIFGDNYYCNFRTGQTRERAETKKYFQENYPETTGAQLGIDQNKILIIHTQCTGTPFSHIVVLTDNRMMISWDGTFFFLTREQ